MYKCNGVHLIMQQEQRKNHEHGKPFVTIMVKMVSRVNGLTKSAWLVHIVYNIFSLNISSINIKEGADWWLWSR